MTRYNAIGVDDQINALHVWDRRSDIIYILHHASPSGRVQRYALTDERGLNNYIDSVDATWGWQRRDNRFVELDSTIIETASGIAQEATH